VNLHVERHGAGPNLVLLHGWGLHGGAWAHVVPDLARHFTVHVVDLPGHGRSAQVQAGAFEVAVTRVEAILPPRAVVCGWSLGGLFAQRLAARGAVAGVALVATTPCFTARDDWPHGMKAATLQAFAQGLHRDRERTLRDFVQLNALHGAHAREAVRALALQLADHPAPVAALEASLHWLRDTDLRSQAAAIAVPAVVVHGTRDALAPVEAGRWLASHIRGARLVELANAAHLPFFTHRAEFIAALDPFRV
jgi:pimeloyl-[acyl-carrier protein] methyl ester esterase